MHLSAACRREPNGGLVIASAIYKDVIPHVLIQGASDILKI
ncbi:hypothetical protein RIVM261_090690 [Rivularia sp. IAM M-261]|nr:hypothetical protein RIVM261_090690 [Rivularia sp. IAM M-261]